MLDTRRHHAYQRGSALRQGDRFRHVAKADAEQPRSGPHLEALLAALNLDLIGAGISPPGDEPGGVPDAIPVVEEQGITCLQPQPVRLTARPAPRVYPAWSPDGLRIAFARALDERKYEVAWVPAAGGPERCLVEVLPSSTPFITWTPDGQWIGFWSGSDSALKKISIAGGAPITISKVRNLRGASWDGDEIVFGDVDRGIMRVSANADEPEILVNIKPEEGIALWATDS